MKKMTVIGHAGSARRESGGFRLRAWRSGGHVTQTALSALVIWLAVAGICQAALTLDWYTVDGGGGISTGGAFAVSGTAGQPDAGERHAGGTSWLRGGFWAFLDERLEPPSLAIMLAPGNVIKVFWPSPSTGFVLQQTTNLVLGLWGAPAEPTQDDGTNRYILVNPPVAQRLYRLLKP